MLSVYGAEVNITWTEVKQEAMSPSIKWGYLRGGNELPFQSRSRNLELAVEEPKIYKSHNYFVS